jgi:hypothetical protein
LKVIISPVLMQVIQPVSLFMHNARRRGKALLAMLLAVLVVP